MTQSATAVLGPQYVRSRDLLEIDITYVCNMSCLNCNRSVGHAPEALHLDVDRIRDHVNEWLSRGHRWRRIRVLGGEPTLHPQFGAVVDELVRYREKEPDCIIEIVTNGRGHLVNKRLAELPPGVLVDNSNKSSNVNPDFRPFSVAPIDDPRLATAAHRNGCAVMRDCGMGLTPSGYYPCAVAGGIDRVAGENLGVPNLPADTDDMLDAADRLCRLCGRFSDGHFVPRALRTPLTTDEVSRTWREMYADWRAKRKNDERGGK